LKYAIDTSAILDGHVRFYAPDVFPSVWEQIDDLISSGDLRSPEEVLRELAKKDDEVHKWARRREKQLFVQLDTELQRAVTAILGKHVNLVKAQKTRSVADPFVIGLAQINSCAVVTAERASGSLNRPKIPDVCRDLGIECISLLELLRRCGFRK